MLLAEEIISILACPKCRGDLNPAADGSGLLCKACNLVYPVRNDVPVLLIEDAQPLEGAGE